MKGIILAGGLGSRLFPLTKITNKHLLPIYNKPMVYYPLETLVNAGIKDIMIVTGGNNAGDFLRLLENGNDFGLEQVHYSYQRGEGGIADALKITKNFAGNDKIVVILGDNIIEKDINRQVKAFESQKEGAMILLKEVDDPERFGVPEISDNKIKKIVEKPKHPPSKYAVTGIYFYDSQVYDFIDKLKPSDRNELEITDVNNFYIKKNQLEYEILDGWWTDAGTFNSLLKANQLIAEKNSDYLQT